MSELLGVEICLFPLTRLIAYTTACSYRTSRENTQLIVSKLSPIIPRFQVLYISRVKARPVRSDWIYLCRFPTACCVRNWQSSFAAAPRGHDVRIRKISIQLYRSVQRSETTRQMVMLTRLCDCECGA